MQYQKPRLEIGVLWESEHGWKIGGLQVEACTEEDFLCKGCTYLYFRKLITPRNGNKPFYVAKPLEIIDPQYALQDHRADIES